MVGGKLGGDEHAVGDGEAHELSELNLDQRCAEAGQSRPRLPRRAPHLGRGVVGVGGEDADADSSEVGARGEAVLRAAAVEEEPAQMGWRRAIGMHAMRRRVLGVVWRIQRRRSCHQPVGESGVMHSGG